MLWIRFGFNPDPDSVFFYLNADPDPGQTFKSHKVEFLHGKYPGILKSR